MYFYTFRFFLQVALSVVEVYRYGERTIKYVRVRSNMFLFANIPISYVRIIPVYIWYLAPASFSLGGNRSSGLYGLL